MGGPLGAYLPPARFDLPMDYEAFAEAGAMVGHGGVVVWDDTMDASVMARFAMEFCAKESCGKCTPCRIGSTRGRRGHRPDPGGARRRRAPHPAGAARGPLHDDDQGVAVRDGRADADAGAQRARALPRGLRGAACDAAERSPAMTMIDEPALETPDRGTPPVRGRGHRARDDRRHPGDGAGRHLGDAGRLAGRGHRAEAVRHRLAQGVRVVPALPRRGRGREGHARRRAPPRAPTAWSCRPAPSRCSSCAAA